MYQESSEGRLDGLKGEEEGEMTKVERDFGKVAADVDGLIEAFVGMLERCNDGRKERMIE